MKELKAKDKKEFTSLVIEDYYEIIKAAKKEFEYLGIKNPRKIKLLRKELIRKLQEAS